MPKRFIMAHPEKTQRRAKRRTFVGDSSPTGHICFKPCSTAVLASRATRDPCFAGHFQSQSPIVCGGTSSSCRSKSSKSSYGQPSSSSVKSSSPRRALSSSLSLRNPSSCSRMAHSIALLSFCLLLLTAISPVSTVLLGFLINNRY